MTDRNLPCAEIPFICMMDSFAAFVVTGDVVLADCSRPKADDAVVVSICDLGWL
jgi:hypothetical protein